jgi:hypothetical protein
MQHQVRLLLADPVHKYKKKKIEDKVHSALDSITVQAYLVLISGTFWLYAFQVGDVQFKVVSELNYLRQNLSLLLALLLRIEDHLSS